MTPQPAVLDPIPDHARHLFLELPPGVDPRDALRRLAAACDGRQALLGIGAPLAAVLGVTLPGLRSFPLLPQVSPAIPATQHALWLWLRGTEPGDLLHQGRALEALAAPAFTRVQVIDAYRYRDSRDLTGYEDGTENPRDDAAALVQGLGEGPDGSSFAAVQQWLHDFPAFDAMSRAQQDQCIGRERDSNEEMTTPRRRRTSSVPRRRTSTRLPSSCGGRCHGPKAPRPVWCFSPSASPSMRSKRCCAA